MTEPTIEERKKALDKRINEYLLNLTRDNRRKVKKMMKEGLSFKQALLAVGYIK